MEKDTILINPELHLRHLGKPSNLEANFFGRREPLPSELCMAGAHPVALKAWPQVCGSMFRSEVSPAGGHEKQEKLPCMEKPLAPVPHALQSLPGDLRRLLRCQD